DIDIKIFPRADDRDLALLFRGSLNGVDNDILNGTLNLHSISEESARILANVGFQFDAGLRRHGFDGLDDLANDVRDRNRFMGRRLHAAVTLPHVEQLPTHTDVLFNDIELLNGAGVLCSSTVGLLEFLGEQLDVSPNDRKRITQIMNKFG